tara:strand:- start:285 stop:500 length:216 start_codon:yes stop_codon:yes gene_type:complete
MRKMMYCACGDFEIDQNRWYNRCITETVTLTCNLCNEEILPSEKVVVFKATEDLIPELRSLMKIREVKKDE